MKKHKQFDTALSVSIQQRREQYPDMTDADVVKALKAVTRHVQEQQWKAEQQQRHERLKEQVRQQAHQRASEMRDDMRQDIIIAGYRLLAQKHHPDKGGSTQTMAKLNRAKDMLLRRG